MTEEQEDPHEVTKFSPSVVIDGRTVTPEGWMWVLGFALGGCDWAIEAASKPEFRARVAESLRKRKVEEAEYQIAVLERKIKEARERLSSLREE